MAHDPVSRHAIVRPLIVPLLLLAFERSVISVIYPLHSGPFYDADPSYVYLFNGLVLLNGSPPFHIDHPGTPVQMMIAAILFIKWTIMRVSGLTADGLTPSVVSHPEPYLLAISYSFLILNAAALTYLGARVQKVTGNFRITLIAQISPIFFSLTIGRLVFPAPESVLIGTSAVLLGQLAPLMFSSCTGDTNPARASPALTGIICGFGIASKVTFLPLLGLILLFRTGRERLRALAFTLAAILILILPIVPQLHKILEWIRSLATHTGSYGTGNTIRFYEIDAFLVKFRQLADDFSLLYVMLAVLLGYLTVVFVRAAIKPQNVMIDGQTTRNPVPARWRAIASRVCQERVAIAFCVVIAGQTLLVLKHFGFHYMIPALPIALMSCAVLLHRVGLVLNKRRAAHIVQTIVAFILICMTIYGSTSHYRRLQNERIQTDIDMAVVDAALQKFPNPVILGTFRCKIQICATFFGAGYAPGLVQKIPGLFANYFDFNIWNSLLNSPAHGWTPVEAINKYLQQGRDVLLLAPTAYPELKTFTLETVVSTPTQLLYRVTGLGAKP